MSQFPHLPLFTDAYLADAGHLSDAEHGRYFLLLMAMWRAPECRIPNDNEWLARRFRRTVEEVISELRPIISEFLTSDGNWLTQKRLRKEWKYCVERSRKMSVKAKSRWDKEKGASQGNAPIPIPRKIDSVSKEDTDAGASPVIDDAEKRLFDRGKQVLGKSAGGMIATLLKAKGGNVALAAAAIEVASTKQSPREYVAACSRGPPQPIPMTPKDQRNQEWHHARQQLREYAYREERSDEGSGPPVRVLPAVRSQ